ncbi:MAG: hypothetical protein M1833_005528 [Piccolia ochrophora]|nr:MAG: hypothetical protein M1833_005528 [Piccolia ochrophora]
MSLYWEAASLLESLSQNHGSLKSQIFKDPNLKSSPKQVFALISEATRWSEVLSEIIERSTLLDDEKKLNPTLAVLLVHDLLLSKRGIAAKATHPLRLAVERHSARLNAEFTRARVRRGCGSLQSLQIFVNRKRSDHESLDQDTRPGNQQETLLSPSRRCDPHYRWVRVNTLKSTTSDQLGTTFRDYTQVLTLPELLSSSISLGGPLKVVHIDRHVPDLLAFPSGTDLSRNTAYQNGELILQDKASCFPAYLLDPVSCQGIILDACAAPGNKTTHLAALLGSRPDPAMPVIWATERDKSRHLVLQSMVRRAGASHLVSVLPEQDFLRINPLEPRWAKIGALLLDPSCSGSGIVGREDFPKITLPQYGGRDSLSKTSRSQKRQKQRHSEKTTEEEGWAVEEPLVQVADDLRERLSSLAAFQLKLLLHAFRFPSATRVSYSTCSMYVEENEQVVTKALRSSVASEAGWRVLQRQDQVQGLRDWDLRGDLDGLRTVLDSESDTIRIADACIRTRKGSIEGTTGFFVAGFVRDRLPLLAMNERLQNPGTNDQGYASEDDEWQGFVD